MLSKAPKAKVAKKNRDTIFPTKTALFLNDIVAITLFTLSFLLLITLITYSPNDKCWFKTSDTSLVSNKLGFIGAYASDFILSLLGFSGWWLILGLFYFGYRKIIRNKIETGDWYAICQAVCFILLIICSSVFEYLNFFYLDSKYLHNGFGGLLGRFMYPILSKYLGQLGVSITSFVLLITCFLLVFRVSLGNVTEKIGLVIDLLYLGITKLLSRSGESTKLVTKATEVEENSQTTATKFYKKNGEMRASPASTKAINNEEDMEGGFNLLFANSNEKITDKGTVDKASSVFWQAARNSLENVNLGETEDNNSKLKKIEDIPNDTKILSGGSKFIHKDFTASSRSGLLPTTDLLNLPKKQSEPITQETLEYVSNTIENKLLEFGVEAKILEAQSGPVVTRYELLPSRGVRGEKIVGLSKEIARGLALSNIRIVETIPGKNTMGVEVPNYKRQTIYLKELLDSIVYKNSISKLTIAFGKDIAGQVVITDLAKMPHLLVAGTTGSGKSVAINTMILSLLFQAHYNEVKFIMIDPKMVELSFYQDIPHLLAPVITDSNYAVNALKWTVGEMERRYKVMAKIGCKNISAFNQKIDEADNAGNTIPNPMITALDGIVPLEKWSYIVVIVDELADLMMSSGKKVEQYIVRIAQKARAVGIHLILATQRPSVDVITGLIKANVPARISFQVASKVDSRTVLDQGGAEALLGQGDMLYLSPGFGHPQRIHGAFVNDDEINRVASFLKSTGVPEYVEDILSGELGDTELPGLDDSSSGDNPEKDEIFDAAVKFIYDTKRCSISSLQTRFGIGYNRAARIMAYLETIGMVRRNGKGGFELLKTEG